MKIRGVGNLVVKAMKNPLIIILDVLSCHSDAEVAMALQRQNAHLIGDIPTEEMRIWVKYRHRTRDPHTFHVIL